MATKLKNLRIREVSAVDRGAGEGVRVLLTKRGTHMSEPFTKFLATRITKAREAFLASVASILGDDKVTDKPAVIAKSADQLLDHVDDLVADVAKSMAEEADGEESEMKLTPELKKALGLPETATEDQTNAAISKALAESTLAVAKLTRDLAIVNLSPIEREHFAKLSGDDADKFLAADTDTRKAAMLASVPKVDPAIAKVQAENDELRKMVAKLAEDSAIAVAKKRAVDIGLSEDMHEVVLKSERGDVAAVKQLQDMLASANKLAREGGGLRELGTHRSDQPAGGYEEMMAKAAELRKADPSLTEAQAFAKVYSDPANAAIAKRERRENRPQVVVG